MGKKLGKLVKVYVQNMMDDDSPLDHDYNISGNQEKRILKFSESEAWSAGTRDSFAAHCKDDGNNIKIKFLDGTKVKLDYMQASQLIVMLLDNCDYKFKLEEKGKTIKSI
jgi:hypothetical protein